MSNPSLAPAIQGAKGRRPSVPTNPAEPPGAADAVHIGEGLGAARSIKAHAWQREANEHYVEPFWCSERLFVEEQFDGPIWDPCCGFGRIPESAVKAGLKAYGTDIVDRGWRGLTCKGDFLTHGRLVGGPCDIVCNPPFNIAPQFAAAALRMPDVCKVAMVFPTARLNAAHWLHRTPLARVWLMTPRPSMPPGYTITAGEKPNGGKMDFCWLIWTKGHVGPPVMQWLRRDVQTSSTDPSFTDRPFGAPL